MKVLHINSSARNDHSQSLKVANHLIAELQRKNKVTSIDKCDLFVDDLPEFGTLATDAKMALFSGSEQTPEQKAAWSEIRAVFDRFADADLYIFNIPLWNNSIPYKLKQFIDVITQPGWAFGFDLNTGYFGLLQNKQAIIIQASGVYYEGIAPNFGSDFSTPYMQDWLNFIGITNTHQVYISPTVVNANYEETLTSTLNDINTLVTKI